MSTWVKVTLAKNGNEFLLDLERVVAIWPSTIGLDKLDEDHNPINEECTTVRQIAGNHYMDWQISETVEEVRIALINLGSKVA